MFNQYMKPWQVILIIVVVVVILAIVLSLPDSPLGTRCMDTWCLNQGN